MPEGTSHLVEHLCVFHNIETHVRRLDALRGVLNGRVDRDRTCFWSAGLARLGGGNRVAARIVTGLVGMLSVDEDEGSLAPLLQRVIGDVDNEMLYRQNEPAHWLAPAIVRGLYPDHPLARILSDHLRLLPL